ncbi:MAG: hypothetical protein GEU26_05005 [Nitrososphaeraceae archaeon]|nr:hypothetical protein [Nitrososphaeraceae archaeon]
MKRFSNSHSVVYNLEGKPKIVAPLFLTSIAVLIVLVVNASTGSIAYSQIMPTNSSINTIENKTISPQMEIKNMTSNQTVVKDGQNTNESGILSNSSLNNTLQNNASSLENATKPQSIIPQVKITSLTKGQEVYAGTLSINGVSSDNSSSGCDVYVLLNGIKPYQRVTPAGQGDPSNSTTDYSMWRFTFLPTYGLIAEGDNKMTAKITCINGSINATKFNSLNVTGVLSNVINSNTSIPQTVNSLQGSDNATTNSADNVQGNSTSLKSTYSPPVDVHQTPTTGGITPQTNYYGITPSSPHIDEIPIQNSSLTEQEEQKPMNGISILEDKDLDSDQLDSVDKEISVQTKRAVDEFISKVQGTVEERIEEALRMRTPFQLVTPTPFDSEDD